MIQGHNCFPLPTFYLTRSTEHEIYHQVSIPNSPQNSNNTTYFIRQINRIVNFLKIIWCTPRFTARLLIHLVPSDQPGSIISTRTSTKWQNLASVSDSHIVKASTKELSGDWFQKQFDIMFHNILYKTFFKAICSNPWIANIQLRFASMIGMIHTGAIQVNYQKH